MATSTDTLSDITRLRRRAANTIRGLSMDAVEQAQSGHPGMPMGMADAAVVLWTEFLDHSPMDEHWLDRDRFVLSAGHGSMLLYSLLHLTGYDLSMEEIKRFRQQGSKTPGHPENFLTPGVETTTGPLGQGFANAVGMALAERHLAARFNRPSHSIVDHYTYVIASDGDLMEGISNEASSLAGHLGLGKLIVLYDDNGISIDGSTDLTFTEDVVARYDALDWHTLDVDGHDPEAVHAAIGAARDESDRPSLIACRTHIGYGSPNQQDTADAHGSPLGAEEVERTKEALGWPTEPRFFVPEDVRRFMEESTERGEQKRQEWQKRFASYSAEFPALANEWTQMHEGSLPEGWDEDLADTSFAPPIATRKASGQVIERLKDRLPWLLGGSADLTGSNKTKISGEDIVTREDFGARYIHYGVREHAMGAVMNGLALHGGIRPFGGTFLVFSDYMRPSIRLAWLMQLPTIYVFTHDSIGLGEDGPTHQPIEHLASLRAMPHMTVFRPADASEVVEAWRAALQMETPVSLVLTRQKLPVLDRTKYADPSGVAKGAYVVADADDPEVILIGTGSELHIALDAWEQLQDEGVPARVVSMPSWRLFEDQSDEYREEVLPPGIRARVAIEAGASFGWERYVGQDGRVIGIDRFGASAPYEDNYEQFGLTTDAVLDAVRDVRS